jgi:DNA-binding CsgD family transcriptional regulator
MPQKLATVAPPARPLAWASAWAARLLRAQQEPAAISLLHQALSALEPLSNFIVFEFALDHQPELIDCNYERDYMLEHMAQYRRGLYLLDPFWRTVVEGRAGLVRMEDIAPEDFRQSEYFQRHYQATGVVDELRYVVPLQPGRSVHVFVEREAPLPVFDAEELQRFGDVEPLVRAFIEAHFIWRDRQRLQATPPRPAFDLRVQIHAMQPGEITLRETDIIELMLKGHSAKSMSSALNIEEGTVTNHKRNIYAKIGIHSQAQLFDRFLRTLTSH